MITLLRSTLPNLGAYQLLTEPGEIGDNQHTDKGSHHVVPRIVFTGETDMTVGTQIERCMVVSEPIRPYSDKTPYGK